MSSLKEHNEEPRRRPLNSNSDVSEQHNTKVPPQSGGSRRGVNKGHSEEPSILYGFLQCVVFIGGMTLFMWLGFMFVYTPLKMNDQTTCQLAEVDQPSVVFMALENKVDAADFGHQLGLDQMQTNNLFTESKSMSDFLRLIIDEWFQTSTPPICWDSIIQALKQAKYEDLASELEEKYQIS